MTEPLLFQAYRNVHGYSARCECRSWIEARSQDDIPDAVALHNSSAEHLLWRCEQDAVEALRRKPVRVCTCHGDAA